MTYQVAVRALCEFTAKCGDLDLRFTPAPSAQEGIAGHTLVQGRRASSYLAEISLDGAYQHLQVKGRADGYDPDQQQLEEIKTHRGDLSLMPANQRELHWAQLRIYGHLFLERHALGQGQQSLRLALVYFHVDDGQETVFYEHHTRATLAHYFAHQCQAFIAFADAELAHRQRRDAWLEPLAFPWPEFRYSQRDLAAAVYNAQRKACCLLAQAPTGIGKTMGTLFPVLKALPGQRIDKVFFLTAKTSGRQLALDALHKLTSGTRVRIDTHGNDISISSSSESDASAPSLPSTGLHPTSAPVAADGQPRAGAPIRVLELVARDKACEHPDLACHGESCPLARGFYDRLPAARASALAHGGQLDQPGVRKIAQAHQVCPYYLAQELTRWADVIIGDYNYYFDISAMLFGLSQVNGWRVSLLVDEAHNLLSRGRSMYSAELSAARLRQSKKLAPASLKKPFTHVQRQWRSAAAGASLMYQVLEQLPAALIQSLQHLCSQISDFLTLQPAALAPEVLAWFFDALHFTRVAELFDAHFVCDLSRPEHAPKDSTLALRNLIPAPFLKPRFAACHAATLFSATLSPMHFYRDTLGLPDKTHWIDCGSPFHGHQLKVLIARHISTRFQHREQSLDALVGLIAWQYLQQNGNYLAFFSSFDYLEQVLQRFAAHHPHIPWWQQTRNMNESERADFLARFAEDGKGIGFAVLGGNFGEGIDLPGTRLVGAFIATLGLPQVNPLNEQLMQKMQAQFGQGYAYTYLYPGLQKVVQAAGRVIRTTTDQGTLMLIDDRFDRPDVRALLPAWWALDDAPLRLT